MEQYPRYEAAISPSVDYPKEWRSVLATTELVSIFQSLVDMTIEHTNTSQEPWAEDRQAVEFRWQHLIERLGEEARSWSHPIFDGGAHLTDKILAAHLMHDIPVRSGAHNFIEDALVLTHHLAVRKKSTSTPGLSVDLNNVFSLRSTELPSDIFDLRDMAEPVSIMADVSFEAFALMDEAAQQRLLKCIQQADATERFGRGGGWWPTPQIAMNWQDANCLNEYRQLLEYGTTDRQQIAAQRNERKRLEITRKRTDNPDFGKLPDNFELLDQDTKQNVSILFEYFDTAREPYNYPTIDTYSLFRMDFTDELLNALLAKQILVNERQFTAPDGSVQWQYELAPDYYECWVARHYPATNN